MLSYLALIKPNLSIFSNYMLRHANRSQFVLHPYVNIRRQHVTDDTAVFFMLVRSRKVSDMVLYISSVMFLPYLHLKSSELIPCLCHYYISDIAESDHRMRRRNIKRFNFLKKKQKKKFCGQYYEKFCGKWFRIWLGKWLGGLGNGWGSDSGRGLRKGT